MTTCAPFEGPGDWVLHKEVRGELPLPVGNPIHHLVALLLERTRKIESLGELGVEDGVGAEPGLDNEQPRRALRVAVEHEIATVGVVAGRRLFARTAAAAEGGRGGGDGRGRGGEEAVAFATEEGDSPR